MLNYVKKIRKESKKVTWLAPSEVSRETILVIIVSILLILFLGGVNWLLQQGFNNLLTR